MRARLRYCARSALLAALAVMWWLSALKGG